MFEKIVSERASYRIKEGVEEALKDKNIKTERKELLGKLLTAKAKYDKFVSLLRLLKSFLPKELEISDEKLKQIFYNKEHLPFDPKQFYFKEDNLGNGGQVRVYLLQSTTKTPSMVVKVLRPGPKNNSLLTPSQLANELRQERKDLVNLYSSIPDLILKEHCIVMTDPFEKGRVAATIVEEFIDGEISDIFSLSLDKIINIAKNNPAFKDKLIKFIKITLDNKKENNEIVDLLGTKNLSLVTGKNNSVRLVLLDPHNCIKIKECTAEEQSWVKKRLDFLEQIWSALELEILANNQNRK